MRSLLPFICCLISFFASAQSPMEGRVEDVIEDILARLAEEDEGETDYSAYYDDLYEMAQSPLNLNTATREQLEALLFLSDIQVENLHYYLYMYGDMQTVYELRLVEGMDEETIRCLLPFIVVEPGERKPDKLYAREVWRYGRHEVYARFGGNVERAEGYRATDDGKERAYPGSPLHHQLKYRFHYKDRIWAGLTMEKDAGEPFLINKKGYDFYSGYAQVNQMGVFKTLVLGDYRAAFGEGLVVRTGFSLGKSAEALNTSRSPAGLRRSGSADEYNFFRGVGATVRLGSWDVTAFYSHKKIDGDTAGGVFPSIIRTGLHRTDTERSRRHAVRQQVAGGNVTYTHGRLQVGATALHTRLSHVLRPQPALYNGTYFEGDRQTTAGLHYRFRIGKLNVSGETALTQGWAAATVNGVSFAPTPRMGLVAQHRYLSPRYDTFFARVFGQTTSRCMNEHGVYIGAEVQPFRRWRVSAYADVCRYPWLRYGVPSPSTGTEYLLHVEYLLQPEWRMYWRARARLRQKGDTHTTCPTETLVPTDQWQFRYVLDRTMGRFRFQTMLYGNLSRQAGAAWTYGASAVQDVSVAFSRIPLRLDFRYQFFDARDYDNRIYCYERDVLHAFSIPMHYGLGSRYYLNVKYDIMDSLSVWFKVAQTVYADGRTEVGTGRDCTPGNRRTTVRALVRWKF